MPNANERRALWFLAIVAVSGSVVRLARMRHPDSRPDAALEAQLARVDSVRGARETAGRRPQAEGRRPQAEDRGRAAQSRAPRAQNREPKAQSREPIDINRASVEDLEALPGIGPALAQRIVAFRDSAGPFRTLAGLCNVRGIGPAMLVRLRPLVTVAGVAAGDATCSSGAAARTARAARAAKGRPSHRARPR